MDPQLRRIEQTLHRLETDDPPAAPLQARDYHPRLEEYWRAETCYQRRYLGTTVMFRQPAFVADYLERLDALRYERPKDAAKVAAGVVTILLPLVGASRDEILAFACKGIGIYASGHRQSLDFNTAAHALLVGVRLAGRHGLELERAELLQRGAYVLSDQGEFNRALLLLKEAQVIYFDKKRNTEIGKLLTCRAMTLKSTAQKRDRLRRRKGSLAAIKNQLEEEMKTEGEEGAGFEKIKNTITYLNWCTSVGAAGW